MRVAVLVGSMRQQSTTRAALKIAAAGTTPAEVVWLDLRELDLPICDGRADIGTYGGDTARLRQVVTQVDALLVGSPEYYGSLSAALKNALELVGEEPIKGKLVGLLAVARGDAGAMNTLNHLRHVFRWMGAWVLPTQVSIPRAQEAFDAAGIPVRVGLEAELAGLGSELVRYTGLLAGAEDS